MLCYVYRQDPNLQCTYLNNSRCFHIRFSLLLQVLLMDVLIWILYLPPGRQCNQRCKKYFKLLSSLEPPYMWTMILEVRKNISVLQIQPEIPWLQKPVPCVSCAELIRSHYITYFCVAQSCSLIIWAGLGFSRYIFSMRAVRVADYVIPDDSHAL